MTTINQAPTGATSDGGVGTFRLVKHGDLGWAVLVDHPNDGPTSAIVEQVEEWVARAVYAEAIRDADEVVVVPAITVPAYFAEEVAAAREALTEAAGKAEEIYRNLLPHAAKVHDDQTSDGVVRAFDDATGWHELWSEVVDLAGALLVAVGAHEEDTPYPSWIDPADKRAREERELRRMLATLNDEEAEQVRQMVEGVER